MRKLPDHHIAWLEAHPHRSRRWFRARIRDGFDIHHIDGNHDNNDPQNLVLIEHSDHLALHNGGVITPGRIAKAPSKRAKKAKQRFEESRAQNTEYARKLNNGLTR